MNGRLLLLLAVGISLGGCFREDYCGEPHHIPDGTYAARDSRSGLPQCTPFSKQERAGDVHMHFDDVAGSVVVEYEILVDGQPRKVEDRWRIVKRIKWGEQGE